MYYKELYWLKNILKKTKVRIIVYLSSSSVYLNNHPVGTAKIECEKFLIKNKNYDYLQIWRPYNLISSENTNLSDHFHNVLIKKFCLEGKTKHHFNGSEDDARGYSSAKKFCRILIKKSGLNKNFIYEYGNTNTIKVKNIAKMFKKIFENRFKKKIKYTFNSNIINVNIIKSNKIIKSINTKENSYEILKKHFLSKIKLYEKH